MASIKRLLKIAKQVLAGQVIAVVNNQLNIVESQVQNVIRQHIAGLTSDVWRGDGAQRFIDDITDECLPQIARACENVRVTNRNIEVSRDTLEDADQRVKASVNRIVTAFERI
ncbi:MAG: hypothetical protein SF162_06495 [bacterium]|nr:hypothetical protein [bacterium]